MPLQNLVLLAQQGELDFIDPSSLPNPENIIFENAFTTAMDVGQWEDLMKWEVAELELPQGFRASTFSLPEPWASNQDRNIKDESLCTYSADAPFEYADNTTLSSTIMPLDLTNTVSPADLQPPGYVRRSFHAFSTLTESEERELQEIAMPSRLLSQIKLKSEPTSPSSSTSYHSLSPSSETGIPARKTRKRKASTDTTEFTPAISQSRKKGHNAIEKRYRTNLNDKINCLRLGIPSVSGPSDLEEKLDSEDKELETTGTESKIAQQKYGKAAILTRALEYIKHLETTASKRGSELDVLKTRVGAFEKLAMRGIMLDSSKCMGAQGVGVQVKSETLESIQEGTC